MAEATIKQISDFFKTGDQSRDRLSAFAAEWKQLTDADKAEIKALIAVELGL